MDDQSVLCEINGPSAGQRYLRRRVGSMPLGSAVRVAAGAFFRFRYRGARTAALLSESRHVWMGRGTFLHWALWDGDIDIPWVVAGAADAPNDEEELRHAVRDELISYWAASVDRLPQKKSPAWLPLP